MTDLIERVARAICADLHGDPDAPLTSNLADTATLNWVQFADAARDAISAYHAHLAEAGLMVVPRVASDAMRDAASALSVSRQVDSMILLAIAHGARQLPMNPTPLEQWWQAMLDAYQTEPAPKALDSPDATK